MSASRRESVDMVKGGLFGGRHLPSLWADVPAHRLIKRKAPGNPDGAIPALPVRANTSETEDAQKCVGCAPSISAFFGAGHMDIPRLLKTPWPRSRAGRGLRTPARPLVGNRRPGHSTGLPVNRADDRPSGEDLGHAGRVIHLEWIRRLAQEAAPPARHRC